MTARRIGEANGDNRKKALNAALSQIEKQFGKGAVMRMGDGSAIRKSEKNRMSEREMWSAWHRSKPSILRMLIDSVSAALRNLHDVKLSVLPRMADFAKWVTAAEIDLGWTKGTFIKAYETNRMNLVDIALEADIVATAILALMQEAEEVGHPIGTLRRPEAKGPRI